MKKQICVIAAFVLLLTLFAGCAAPQTDTFDTGFGGNSVQEPAAEPAEDLAVMEMKMEESGEIETAQTQESAEDGLLGEYDTANYAASSRKLIYTADYTIQSYAYVEDYDKILAALNEFGGYIASESTYGTEPEAYGDSGRETYFSLRIPIDRYEAFLEALSGIGEVVNKSQNTEDVTTQYYDNETRIEFYEAHYEKLMDYLEQATEMEDILTIEDDIREVLYTLDTLKGEQRYLDNLIEYTTVNVQLYERVKSSSMATSNETFGDRVSRGFNDVLLGLGSFFEGFAVVLIAASPILAILAVIALAIILPIRAHRKKQQRLAATQKAAQEKDSLSDFDAPAKPKDK